MSNDSDQKDKSYREGMESVAELVLEKSKGLSSKLPIVGHVAWLYSQTKTHKYFTFGDVEARILAPLMIKQCKLYVQSNSGGLPTGFISWARLSEEVEQKYIHTQRLSPSDWKSGDRLWMIDVLAPFGGQEAIFREACDSLLKGEEIHLLFPTGDNSFKKTTVNELIKLASEKNKNDAESTAPSTKH